jgi:hypothetical protein
MRLNQVEGVQRRGQRRGAENRAAPAWAVQHGATIGASRYSERPGLRERRTSH